MKRLLDIIRQPKIMRIYILLENFVLRLDKHHIFLLSAGIAFNIILYSIPFTLIGVYFFKLLAGDENIINAFTRYILEFLPPGKISNEFINEVKNEINVLLERSTVFGIVGMVMLLWLSSLLLSSIRTGLNTIFNISGGKFFLVHKFREFVLIIVMTILIFLYSYAVPIFSGMTSFFNEFLPEYLVSFASRILLVGLSLITSFALFYLIYRSVPNKKIKRSIRMRATIIAVILIEIFRHLFAWHLGSISSYGRIYGTYAVLVSIAIWIYYSSLIMLLSAEISRFWEEFLKKE